MGRRGESIHERRRTPMWFSVGDEVEVSWDDEGFGGAWYEAKVTRAMAKTRRYTVVHDQMLVDDGAAVGEQPRFLREIVNAAHMRPRPPRHGGPFVPHQPVEAWHNDGWWTGVVEAAVGMGELYTVCFPNTWERIEFAAADLRAHLEWVCGTWVRPEENNPGPVALAFPVGTRVEVARRTGDLPSMWFIATVEKLIWENNLLVQFESLRADTVGEFLRGIVDARYVRPCLPPTFEVRGFNILEEVDVFHDGGWCVGVVVGFHQADSKYNVKSQHWEGEMEFSLSDLRVQHEWTDGHWVQASKARYIKSRKPHWAKSVKHSQGSHARSHARKPRDLASVSLLFGSQSETINSNTEIEDASTFEDKIAHLQLHKNRKEVDVVEDDIQFSLTTARAAKFLVQAGNEFVVATPALEENEFVVATPALEENEFVVATPALEEGGISHIICTSMVQQLPFKKQSKQRTAKRLNFDGKFPSGLSLTGEDGILVGNKAENRSRGQNYPFYITHEMEDVYDRIKWAHKRARSPRTSSPKVMGEQTGKKRRHIRRAENTESSPKGKLLGCDSLDICQTSIQLTDEVVGEPSQGSPLLLQLDPVLERYPSLEGLPAQEHDVIMSPNAMSNETSRVGVQLNEGAKENQTEDLFIGLGGFESHEIITEEADATVDSTPFVSPTNFNLPFDKRSSMWEAIEATEVFHSMPQQPHFQPLLKCWGEFREGMAIGLMVTFNSLVTGIIKLQITNPEPAFLEKLKILNHLESHGFDVHHARDRLEMLLRIKYSHKQHEDKRTALQRLILNRQNERQKVTDEIETIDKILNELDKAMAEFSQMRSIFVMQKETIDHEISKLQIDVKVEAQSSFLAAQEFDGTLAALW